MNYFKVVSEIVCSEIQNLIDEGKLVSDLNLGQVGVETTRDPVHGDLASNAAMVLANSAKTNPKELGQLIIDRLVKRSEFEFVSLAGPGFINLKMVPEFWTQLLPGVLGSGLKYGDCDLGRAETINVEYVSAKPTGPMHIGHARGAVIGDARGNLLSKAGYEVTREYYVNDAGAQIDVLARSVHLRYLQALGEKIDKIPDGLYPGEYLQQTAKDLVERDGSKWRELTEDIW